jgi:hypothetical protein
MKFFNSTKEECPVEPSKVQLDRIEEKLDQLLQIQKSSILIGPEVWKILRDLPKPP